MSTRRAPNHAPVDGGPLVDMSSSPMPLAFADSAEGAKAALEAARHATALLTELHLGLASREIAIFLQEHPGIESMGLERTGETDDEGGRHTRIDAQTLFVDGTGRPRGHGRGDGPGDVPALAEGRDSLHQAAEAFLHNLADSLPCARRAIEDAMHTRASAKTLAGGPFAARQERFAIARSTSPGHNQGPELRL